MEKNLKKMSTYVWLNHLEEINTTLQINCTSIKKNYWKSKKYKKKWTRRISVFIDILIDQLHVR